MRMNVIQTGCERSSP